MKINVNGEIREMTDVEIKEYEMLLEIFNSAKENNDRPIEEIL